jgi:hypothetical protein
MGRVAHSVMAGCAAFALAVTAAGQSATRLATTRALLLSDPLFFHSRTIAIIDTPRLTDGVWRLPADENKSLIVVFRTAPSTDRAVEIRGTFLDVGRLAPNDSRVTTYNLREAVDAALGTGAPWPNRETFFAIVQATSQPPDLVAAGQSPSLRQLALSPVALDGKPVTVRGRFRGRNLAGDLPRWPRRTEYDFVLQSADGATWVTGQRPRGKGFDLNPTARKDLGRWLEVTGVVTIADGLPMIKATSVAPSAPIVDEPEGGATPEPTAPVLPPPAVSFTLPANGETGVAPDTPVRLQFSRDMDSDTFAGRVTVRAAAAGAPVDVPPMKIGYRPGILSMELTFEAPLPRFATITIDLGAGITAPDGTPLPPMSLSFTTGGGR